MRWERDEVVGPYKCVLEGLLSGQVGATIEGAKPGSMTRRRARSAEGERAGW